MVLPRRFQCQRLVYCCCTTSLFCPSFRAVILLFLSPLLVPQDHRSLPHRGLGCFVSGPPKTHPACHTKVCCPRRAGASGKNRTSIRCVRNSSSFIKLRKRGAGGRSRIRNLLSTNQWLCQLSYATHIARGLYMPRQINFRTPCTCLPYQSNLTIKYPHPANITKRI